MKAIIISIFLLVSLVTFCRGQSSPCEKPFELLGCQGEVSKSGDNFCSALSVLRKCFVEDAKCPEDFFNAVKEKSEEQLGIKCGACALPIPSVFLLTVVGIGYYFLAGSRN